MDPDLAMLAAGMNEEEIEEFACWLEAMAHELRWAALEQLGVIDPLKVRSARAKNRNN